MEDNAGRKVKLAPELSFNMNKENPEFDITTHAVEGHEMAKLHFENREEANPWVLQHLGIEL